MGLDGKKTLSGLVVWPFSIFKRDIQMLWDAIA
jgi:hypothetical protein